MRILTIVEMRMITRTATIHLCKIYHKMTSCLSAEIDSILNLPKDIYSIFFIA